MGICVYGGIVYGSEELEESEIGDSLGSDSGYDIGSSDDILYGNEDDKLEGSSLGGSTGS